MATKIHKKIFFVLYACCMMGAWSVIPYLYYLGTLPSTHTFGWIFLITTIQAAIFYGLALWFSYLLLPRTDLEPFRTPDKRSIIYGVSTGILVGLIIFALENTLFQNSTLSTFSSFSPVWARLLASIYGGINEEVLLRLFLFTLVYFLLSKISKNRPFTLWTTNILVALLFGIGHLPAAFKIASATSFEIYRVLFINGVAGLAFGWLYWSHGFSTAVLAHFITDIMIHVIFI